MNIPTIDVIVAFHRNDAYLSDALASIRKSKNVKVRTILVDDRKEIGPPPRQNANDVLIKTKGGEGFEAAINLGSTRIVSEYVAILGSDDLMSPNRLKQQINDLKNSGADLSICRIIKFNEKGTLPSLNGRLNGNKYFHKILLLTPFGADGTWVANSSWWEKNMKFQFLDNDWALALRLRNSTKVNFTANEYVYYRMHENQITRSKEQIIRQGKSVYPNWLEYVRELGLPELGMNEFLDLVQLSSNKVSRSNRSAINSWLTKYWANLTYEEKNGLKQIFRRKIIFTRSFLHFRASNLMLIFFAIREVPALAWDLTRLLFNLMKGGRIDLRSRLRVDI